MKNQNTTIHLASIVADTLGELGPLDIQGTDLVQTVEGAVDGIHSEPMSNMSEVVNQSIAQSIPDQVMAKDTYSDEVRNAAAIGGILGSDPSASFNQKLTGYHGAPNALQSDMMQPIGKALAHDPGAGFALAEQTVENYEDSATKSTVMAAITYNLNSALQNKFSAGFFKAKSIAPGSVGIVVVAEEIVIVNEFEHGPNGDPIKPRGTPLIRALSSPEILNIDHTKIIPIVLPDRNKYFVDPAMIAAETIKPFGEDIDTAPLATGVDINMLSLSQSAGDMSVETLNRTDTIDPAVVMKALYIKVGDDILKYKTTNMPGVVFNYDGTSSDRRMNLGVSLNSLVVTENTLDNDQAALVTLASVATDKLKVRLSMYLSGYIDLDTGKTHVGKAAVTVHSVSDEDDIPLAETDARYAAILTAVEGSELIAFDILASKTNANRRERGLLFDTKIHMQPYNVPYGSPYSILRAPGSTSASYDQKLIGTLTDISRTASNLEAPQAILDFAEDMINFENVIDDELNPPDTLGPARFLMTPYFTKGEIDLSSIVASVSTHEVGDDTTMAIINYINSILDELLTKTHIVDAYERRYGSGARPTVLIGGTNKVMQRLEHPGNPDMLCPGFSVVKLVTNHPAWRNKAEKLDKIFISFDNPEAPGNDPLSFGFFAWAPVTPLNLGNTQRGNTTSRELTVTPRSEFFVNAVSGAIVDVIGLTDMSREPVIARVKAVP